MVLSYAATMRATILTIFPDSSYRQVETGSTPAGKPSPQRTEALVPARSVTGSTTPSIESVILDKLLAELDAREIARAQPPYLMEQARPLRHTHLLRTLWALVWALSIGLSVFVVKYIDSQKMAQAIDSAQTHSLNNLTAAIGDQKNEFAKMIDSVQSLAGVMAETSARTAAIPEMLKRLGNDFTQAAPPVEVVGESAPAPAPASLAMIAPPPEENSAAIPMGGHHHPPMEYAVAPDGVVVHHNYLGVMDYWMVPRMLSGVLTMTKVVPIAQSNAGIFVHDVAEIRDYIVTPSGDWIATSEPIQKH